MNDWDRIRQEQKYKQKLLNTKSTLPKITFSNNSSAKKKNWNQWQKI
jgi:hypothetical protein